MRKILLGAALSILIPLLAGTCAARDFRVITDDEVSGGASKPARVKPSSETDIKGNRDRQVEHHSGSERPGEPGLSKNKFPNPYIVGRGYENQGINMAVFGEPDAGPENENGSRKE